MPPMIAKRTPVLACAVLLIPAAVLAAAGATDPRPSRAKPDAQSIDVKSKGAVVDPKNNSLEFKDIVVTWRDMRLEADHAHAVGPDTDNNDWTFSGNVRIHSERGDMRADQAVVEFRKNEISKATITGNPAEFEQKPNASDREANGQAREIVYDVAGQTLRLSGCGTTCSNPDEALINVGRYKATAPQLVYNMRTQAYEADQQPGTDSRVHFTIPPRAKESETKP